MTVAASAVAAYGLPSAHTLPDESIEGDDAAALLAACAGNRITGLLANALRDGALLLDEAGRADLEHELQSWLGHDLRLERLALRAVSELASAGIPSRVLKGVALAHTTYGDPAERIFGDVDLLVPSADFTRAQHRLAVAFHGDRPVPELRPGFDDRFGTEALLRIDGLELDLHRVFVDGAFGLTIDLDDLFTPPYRFALGSYELEALPMPQRLLHACYAASIGDWPPRLVALRDVAEIVLREKPHLVDVLLMARRWRCEVLVAQAVTNAWDELWLTPRPPIVEWAARYTPSRTERLLVAAHQGTGRSFTRHAAALVVIPGVADRWRYLVAIAVPQRSYLRARGMTLRGHVSRAARRIFR